MVAVDNVVNGLFGACPMSLKRLVTQVLRQCSGLTVLAGLLRSDAVLQWYLSIAGAIAMTIQIPVVSISPWLITHFAGLLQLPLQLIAIHRLDGDFTGADQPIYLIRWSTYSSSGAVLPVHRLSFGESSVCHHVALLRATMAKQDAVPA